MNDKFFGMIGLAMRSGAAAVGEGKAVTALRSGKASVLIIAKDASDNTRKKFGDLCSFRNIPIIEADNRGSLGRALGRDFAVTAAITDENFSRQLLNLSDIDG